MILSDACTVIIDGETWYIPCDRVNDIGFDQSGNLVVLTSSSLTLYKTFNVNYNNYTYPRVACNFGRVCYLQEASQDYQYLTDSSLEIGQRSFTDDFYFIGLIAVIAFGVVLWNLFKR